MVIINSFSSFTHMELDTCRSKGSLSFYLPGLRNTRNDTALVPRLDFKRTVRLCCPPFGSLKSHTGHRIHIMFISDENP